MINESDKWRSRMDHWERIFNQETYIYGTEANQFIQEAVKHLPNEAKVAAYAEGEGRNAVFLAQKGFQVTAYDYALSGLEKTKVLANKRNVSVETKRVDLISDPLLTNAYDAAIMVFGHFPKDQQYQVLDKIVGSIKDGGLLLLEVYEDAQINYGTGGPKDVNMLYNAVDLLRWSRQYRIKHFFTGEVERYEGKLHHGLSSVVQVIIQK